MDSCFSNYYPVPSQSAGVVNPYAALTWVPFCVLRSGFPRIVVCCTVPLILVWNMENWSLCLLCLEGHLRTAAPRVSHARGLPLLPLWEFFSAGSNTFFSYGESFQHFLLRSFNVWNLNLKMHLSLPQNWHSTWRSWRILTWS